MSSWFYHRYFVLLLHLGDLDTDKDPAVQSTYKNKETSLLGIAEETTVEEFCPYGKSKQQLDLFSFVFQTAQTNTEHNGPAPRLGDAEGNPPVGLSHG